MCYPLHASLVHQGSHIPYVFHLIILLRFAKLRFSLLKHYILPHYTSLPKQSSPQVVASPPFSFFPLSAIPVRVTASRTPMLCDLTNVCVQGAQMEFLGEFTRFLSV